MSYRRFLRRTNLVKKHKKYAFLSHLHNFLSSGQKD